MKITYKINPPEKDWNAVLANSSDASIFHHLDFYEADDLIRIMLEPKNAIVKQYQKIFEMENAVLEFTEDIVQTVKEELNESRNHQNTKTGIQTVYFIN